MDLRLALLAFTAFAVGLDENIVVGILPQLARDLGVEVAAAGQLTSLFSLTLAIAAPLLWWATRALERRRLLCLTLLGFALANLLAALSPGYLALALARVAMAACCGLILVLTTTQATRMAAPEFRGRAIGLVFMGVSAALVLGVPLGILVSDAFGWRWVFAGIGLYSLPLAWLLHRLLPTGHADALPGWSAWRLQLGHPALALGHGVSVLMIGGHFCLFAFLGPWLLATGQASGAGDSGLMFLLFGVAAVSGGWLGGLLVDRVAPQRALVGVPGLFLLALASLALAVGGPLSVPLLMAWSALSWMISPVVQSYLLARHPQSAEAAVAVNSSAMHLGVALGGAVGGLAAHRDLLLTPWVGCLLVAAALACALLARRAPQVIPG
ncbi:MFS transporter [Pseudomonas sp. TUM22785]|uniref:MFS transporter n=1 Tax=Pseudomonas sp. TUM22785 TaxID=3019098 RepID=UPI002306B143|nr:MFS transporter [Pseudomonas sp. TUM22785]WCD82004.1 MFS transporter [Pseudomonas sp. TUM22785]